MHTLRWLCYKCVASYFYGYICRKGEIMFFHYAIIYTTGSSVAPGAKVLAYRHLK